MNTAEHDTVTTWKPLIPLLGLITAMVLLTSLLQPLCTDDYIYANLARGQGLVGFLAHFYLHWFGRMQGMLGLWLGLQNKATMSIFGLSNGLGFVGLAFLAGVAVLGRWPRLNTNDRYPVIALLAALWFLTPVIGQVAFWKSGAVFYLWPAFWMLVLLIPYRFWWERIHRGSDVAPAPSSAFKTVGMLILGAWAAMSQEQVLISEVFIFTVWVGYLWRNRLVAKVPVHLYVGLVGVALGGASLLLAPGNSVRARGFTLSFTKKLADYIGRTMNLHLTESTVAALLVAVVLAILAAGGLGLLLLMRKVPSQVRTSSLFWMAVAFVSFFPLLAIPTAMAVRTFFFPLLFLLIGLCPVMGHVSRGFADARWQRILQIVLVIVAADTSFSASLAWSYSDVLSRREARITEALQRGSRDVLVPPLSLPRKTSIHFDDISTDPNNWKNSSMASYYRLNSLALGSVEHEKPTDR